MCTRRHVWDQFYWKLLENDDEESDSQDVFKYPRREYKMSSRISIETWDDLDFFMRFRLQKKTVMMVLDIIRPHLEVDETRYKLKC